MRFTMPIVYFSHTGNKKLTNNKKYDVNSGTVNSILKEINNKKRGIIDDIIDINNNILPSVKIFKNIKYLKTDNRFYEKEETEEIKDVEQTNIHENENLLISIFDIDKLESHIKKSLGEISEPFRYIDYNKNNREKDYKKYINNSEIKSKKEIIYKFKMGNCKLQDLKTDKKTGPKIQIENNEFNKKQSIVLPEEIINAVRKIWEIDENKNSKLRLFQEDCLFFIISNLMKLEYPKEKHLLLSMPTGGGKTEAFMIPVISDIFFNKKDDSRSGVQSIVIYPTNALANDQAKRFVDLLYNINYDLIQNLQEPITIGILSGDTPKDNRKIEEESLIQICPKCGSGNLKKKDKTLICRNSIDDKLCNTSLSFCRLSKDDIVERPPDILITNPDMINYSLHSPKYSKLFYNKVNTMIFDEVHMYEGIFGCHVSHLLRRLEEISENKPTYIGLSATIGNAKELAALLFNSKKNNIHYVHNRDNKYTTNEEDRYRKHILIKPAITSKKGNKAKYVRSLSVAGVLGMFLGHMISDSHFRKTLIFANYRSESDDLSKYLKERELFDLKRYFKNIESRIKNNKPLDREAINICLFIHKWITYLENKGMINKGRLQVGWNRGGLEKEERIRAVHSFISNKILSSNHQATLPNDLMVATKTLELGIDIGDVSTVINSSAPFTSNEYVQRVGRGGRKKNSLAITVINPERGIDAYFNKNFDNYVEGTDYEDAPIIISNEIVLKSHIEARILDYFVRKMKNYNKYNITVSKLIQYSEEKHFGGIYKIEKKKNSQEIDQYCDLLFKKVFIDTDNLNSILDFLKKEKSIIGIKNEISKENIREYFKSKLKIICTNISEEKWDNSQFITGWGDVVMEDITPNLRNSGPTVNLYVHGENNENKKPKDTVPSYRAFNNMPPAQDSIATLSSGVCNFNILSTPADTSEKSESKIKEHLGENLTNAKDFFTRKLDDFPEEEDIIKFYSKFSVIVTKDLQVKYFPNRFYCEHCKTGLIPPYEVLETGKNSILCKYCKSNIIQLPMVYQCNKCGHLMEPPVQKICLNPQCTDFNKFYQMYKEKNGNFNMEKMTKHFQFRLTRDMEWECLTCHTKMDFAENYKNKSNNYSNKYFIKNVIDNWDDNKKSKVGMAVFLKKYPEYYKSNNTSHFNCSKNYNHKKISKVPVPRVRTISASYYKKNKKLKEPIKTKIGKIEFREGSSIQLTNKYFRRYRAGIRETKYKFTYNDIFQENHFLGNYLESHFAWINFSSGLDNFINKSDGLCNANCEECDYINNLDLSSTLRPKKYLEDYNWNEEDNIPRKPDKRGYFCKKAFENNCKKKSCENCEQFNKIRFLKFIIVHTLKHGIIWTLPKYAGINVSEIRGEVYPNDNDKQLLLYDTNEGGSGAILLIEKHWDKIWRATNEIIEEAANNNGSIILPHTCNFYNANICPFITNNFLNSITNTNESK